MAITEKNLHTKIKTVEKSGSGQVIKILYPTNYDSDVLLIDHKNTNIPSSAVTVKDVIDSVGSLAFKSSIDDATTSSSGLMSATDKQKIDMIDLSTGAVGTITSVQVNGTSIASKGVANIPLANGTKTAGAILTTSTVTSATGYTASPVINGVPYYKNTIYDDATQSKHGLMTAADKTKLDGIATGANNITVDSTLSATSTNPVQNKVLTSATGVSTLLNQLNVGNADPVDDNYYIAQDVSGTNQYVLRKHSSLYNYMKSKIGTGKVTINRNGTATNSFTLNQTTDVAINFDNATTTSDGLMSSEDKTLLRKLVNKYEVYRNDKTGYFKVKINSTTNWKMSIHLRLYSKYKIYDMIVSGYNYFTDKKWYAPKATLLGSDKDNSINVIFGYDGDNDLWFAVPHEMYSTISIVDITQDGDYGNTQDLFTITETSSLDNLTTIQATVTAYNQYTKGDFSLVDNQGGKQALGWKDSTSSSKQVPTMNTLAYWNGAFQGTTSNLTYTAVGALGSAATLSKANVIKDVSISSNKLTFTKADTTTKEIPLPTYSNTTYAFATGTANGTISVKASTDSSAKDIAVKGLGSAAYTASTDYATSEQGTKADNAMPTNGGTFTGSITLNADPTTDLGAATKKYVDNKVSNAVLKYTASKGLTITSGNDIQHTNSITAGTAQGDDSKTLTWGGTFAIPTVTYDDYGHITDSGTTTMKMPVNPNTDTKVTSVGNHYIPVDGTTLSASGGTLTDIANSTAGVQVITGITKDAAGHITGITSKAIKATNNTYTTGSSTTSGITKLYSTTGTSTDGTMTQRAITDTLVDYDTTIDTLVENINNKIDRIDVENNYATNEDVDNSITQANSYTDTAIENVNNKCDEISDQIDSINNNLNLSDYVRGTNDTLELGYSNNTYIQKNDNNKIAFYQGDTIIASIHDNKIESNNISVTKSIIIGDETNGFFELAMDSSAGLVMR